MTCEQTVVAFIHVEPPDVMEGNSVETKLVKSAKWVARKWETQKILLHSFTHLGEEKADPEDAKALCPAVKHGRWIDEDLHLAPQQEILQLVHV